MRSQNNMTKKSLVTRLRLSSLQRKELGVLVFNCSCLALDLHRLFSLYWGLEYKEFIPSFWSKRLFALFNRNAPLNLTLNRTKMTAYISVSAGGDLLLFACTGLCFFFFVHYLVIFICN